MRSFTRREVVGFGLAALPTCGLRAWGLPPRPDSKFGGVQIGIIISPYNYSEIPVPADQLLSTLLQLGISAIEMQDVRVETYAGAPALPREGYSGSPSAAAASGGHALSAQEQEAAHQKTIEELRQWRLSAPFNKYKALKKLYDDAGVNIYAFRLANMTQDMPDAEYEYFFHAARALGANQITVELPEDPNLTERVSKFAAKYKIRMGYHNHTQVNAHSWDVALAQSPWNGINFDVGHYAAATNESPVPFIKEHHDRITSLHLKDRRFRTNGGRNMPWGEGETSLKEVLQLVKTEHYTFPAAIELEYRIPQGSTATTEIARCVEFCKQALT